MVYTVDPDLIACNGLVYDEYGLDVGRLNDLSYVSSRSYGCQSCDYPSASKRLYEIAALNDKFKWFKWDQYIQLGYIHFMYPEEIMAKDPVDLLRMICRSDRRYVEDCVMAWRLRFIIRKQYLDEWDRILSKGTSPGDVPLDLDLGSFYKKETLSFGWSKCIDQIDDKPLTEDDCKFLEDEHWPNGPINQDARFAIDVTYSEKVAWERKYGTRLLGCTDFPPVYGCRLFFTEEQVLNALYYTALHRNDISVPGFARKVFGKTVYDQQTINKCMLCGRSVSECGALVRRNILHGIRLSGSYDLINFPLTKVLMCDDCSHIWTDFAHDTDAWWDTFYTKYRGLCKHTAEDVANGYSWSASERQLFKAAIEQAGEYCRKHLADLARPKFDLFSVPDLDTFSEYARHISWELLPDEPWCLKSGPYSMSPKCMAEKAGPEEAVPSDYGPMAGFNEPLTNADKIVIERARSVGDLNEAVDILNEWFAPMVLSVQPVIWLGTIMVDALHKVGNYTPRGEPLRLHMFPPPVFKILKDYRTDHKMDVASMVDMVVHNRKVAVRYARAIRMGLEPYMQQLKGDLPFLDIPWYSYYAVVVKTEAGQAQAYSWSLHKMAEEAGVPIHLVHKWCRQYM